MHLVGRYTTDVTRLFTITTSDLKSRWNVYSTVALDDSTTIELNPYDLDRANLKAYNPYLISSCTCIGKGDIKTYYGNVNIITDLIKLLADMSMLDNIFSFTQELGSFSVGTVTVEIISATTSISNAQPIRGVSYIPFRGKQNAAIRSFAYALGKRRVKTLEEVLQTYNTDWMYQDGKLIKDYTLITTQELFDDVVKELSSPSVREVAFDTETTGLRFFWYGGDAGRRSLICGMSLSWKDNQGVYIPFLSTHVDTLDVDKVLSVLVPILNKKTVIAHNGMFDQKVLYAYGYMLKIKEDTMLIEFNLDPRVSKGSKGLKLMTRKYFNHETLELEDILGKNFNAELIPEIEGELIKLYACADTDYTLKLYRYLKKFLTDLDAYKLDMQLVEILSIAEFYSSKIDTTMLKTLSDINEQDLQVVEGIMERYIHEIGMKTQATKFIKSINGDDYEPSPTEVQEVVDNYTFQAKIAPLFRKQTKKAAKSWDPADWKLQVSSPKDIVHILYNILDYPVTQIDPNTGNWKANEHAILDLLSFKTDEPVRFLKDDVYSCITHYDIPVSGKETVLLDKAVFESYQYPFAYILEKWRSLYKFRTSFFNKLQEENTDGWYCTSNSMTSAETSRVINPIQTLVGPLKKLVVPHSDDYYMIVFDMAQIEFRVMLGLANNYWSALESVVSNDIRDLLGPKNLEFLIHKLDNAEADYHREGGAIFAGCTPEDMTKEQRSKVKAVHFSVPYGAGAYSISETKMRAARTEQERQHILDDTEATLAAWRKNLYPLYYYLESKRDKALTQVPDSQLPPLLKGGKWGLVDNPMGRHRWFQLDDLTNKRIAGIRRQAGNYPIQSFAREIFFTAILRLFKRLKREGYITERVGQEKVILNLFVHDECHLMVHKSIHPYKMYQMILEECLIQLSGHPTYYMGISVVDNWYQGKLDEYEAPVDFVRQCVAEYYADPDKYADGTYMQTEDRSQKQFVFDNICKYMAKRFRSEIEQIQADQPDPYLIDPKHFISKFKNYFLKTRYWLYTSTHRRQEYQKDPSLAKDENNIMMYMDAYLRDDDVSNWQKYSMLFDGKPVRLEDMWQAPTISEEKEDDDLDLAFDLDLETDFEEDKTEQEELFHREYYLLTQNEVTISVKLNKQTGAILKDGDDVEVAPPEWNRISWEDFMGRIIINVRGTSTQRVLEAAKYLKKFKSDQGKSLIFFDGREVDSGVRIADSFDKKIVYDILFPEGLQISEAARSRTNHFN